MLATANKPSFGNFNEEDLAATDVYSVKKSTGTINNLPVKPDDVSDKTRSTLGDRVKPITAEDMGNIKYPTVTAVLPGIKAIGIPSISSLPAASIAKSNMALGTSSLNGIKALTGSVAGVMAKALTVAGPILAKTGGITNLVSGIKAGNANILGTVINGMTKAPSSPISFKDPASLISSVVGLTGAGAKLGLGNVLPNVLSGVTAGKTDLLGISKGLLPMIGKTANIPMLGSLANVTSKGGLLAMAPGILTNISSNFKAPDVSAVARLGKEAAGVTAMSSLQSISSTYTATDPNWNKGLLGPLPVPNVAVVASGSNDFKNEVKAGAVASTNPDDKALLYGTMFPSTNNNSTLAQVKQSNPGVYVATGSNTLPDDFASKISGGT